MRPRVPQFPEESLMKVIHLWPSALAVALAVAPAATAGDLFTLGGGVGSMTARFGVTDVPTQTLQGRPVDAAGDDTVPVLFGRLRPYWRGYSHGAYGYAPRPLLYRPFIAARPFGFYRPFAFYRSAYVYAYSYPVTAGVEVTVAPALPPVTV